MRIAHLIITHKNPLQLERLIKKMQHPKFDFYIHLDKKVDIKDFEHLKNISQVYFIQNRVVCNWGGFSTLEAMLNSLSEVLDKGLNYGFYNLLSAQDYPIQSNKEIYNFFLQNLQKSFLFYETDHAEEWWSTAVNRFKKYHLTDFNFKGKTFLEMIINKILPSRTFPISVKLYGGSKSSWWSLNNDCATYLISYYRKQNIKSFLRYCWGTDEFVIPTILMNSPFNNYIVNDNLRYINFPPGKANPKIIGMEDIEQLQKSDMLFARKFDLTSHPEILDWIDNHLAQ